MTRAPGAKRRDDREIVTQSSCVERHARELHAPFLRRGPPISGAKFSNRVYCPRKVSWNSPISPLRCLAMMMSAMPLRGRVLVVDLVAIDQHDQVRVLLDGARLAQVGHHGLLVVALFDAAVELRQRDHRHLQLLGERLERARDLRDLGGAVLLGARHLHELQIVDHDQVQSVFALQAPRTRAHVGRSQRSRYRRCRYSAVFIIADRAVDARPIVVVECCRLRRRL